MKKLADIKKWADGVRDSLGKKIDVKIKEGVIVFNLLGFHTTGSCQGHLSHATGAPYIDIASEYSDTLTVKLIDEEKKGRKWKFLWSKHKKEIEKARKENKIIAFKILSLLDLFYQERKVSSDVRLILEHFGNPGEIRLTNQGAELINKNPRVNKSNKLNLYQKEMSSFINFLKRKYFNQRT